MDESGRRIAGRSFLEKGRATPENFRKLGKNGAVTAGSW